MNKTIQNTITSIIAAVIVLAYIAYLGFKAYNGDSVNNGDVVTGITAIVAAVGFAVNGKAAVKFLLIPLMALFTLTGCFGNGLTNAGQQLGQGMADHTNSQGANIEVDSIEYNVNFNGGDVPKKLSLQLFERVTDGFTGAEQDLTSQPAATGDPEGGDLLSGNPVRVVGPTGSADGNDSVDMSESEVDTDEGG